MTQRNLWNRLAGTLAALSLCIATVGVAVAKEPVAGTAIATEKPQPKIQLAILLDTSGSMDGLINQARTQLWKIVNELATAKRDGKTPHLEVALYEYGKSSIPKSEGYLRQLVPLSDDLDKISDELFSLKTNGGSEHCGQVIDAATTGLKWSRNHQDLKLIFIAGNEAFTQGPVDYKQACSNAIKKGITVNTIFCGPKAQGIRTGWADGAKLADGSFVNIDQNQRVAAVRTPYDKKLTELGRKINSTYVAYGKDEDRKRRANLQLKQDKLATAAAPAAGAARASFKGKAAYRASAWDLVDALKEGKLKLADVKTERLPTEMRKMSLAERKAYVKKKATERKVIQDSIRKISAQREKYIVEERKKQAGGSKKNSLDEAIIQTIQKQAGKKQFRFEKK